MTFKTENTITPEIQNLLDKLKIARQVYEKASSRIHNQLIKRQLSFLSDRKLMFFQNIIAELNPSEQKRELKVKDSIQLELDKALIELNHIILDRNEKEILSLCIKREKELIAIYKKFIYMRSFYPFIEALIVSQLDETIALLHELKETREAFALGPRNW